MRRFGACVLTFTFLTLATAQSQKIQPETCGNLSLSNGGVDRAIADCSEAIRLYPDSDRAFLQRGGFYQRKGEYERAIADFNQAVRLNPDYYSFLNRGLAYQAKGDFDRAIADFNEALRHDPNDIFRHFHPRAAYVDRGRAFQAKGDHDRAIADFNKALLLDRNAYDAASVYKARGDSYYAKGDLDNAIADFSDAIHHIPNYGDALAGRGLAWEAKGDLGRAKVDFDAALAAPQASERTRSAARDRLKALAKSYYVKEDFDGALAQFNDMIRLAPNYADGFTGRGLAFEAKGDLVQAKADFNAALAAKQGSEEARNSARERLAAINANKTALQSSFVSQFGVQILATGKELKELAVNPFLFQNKVIAVRTNFIRMLSEREAVFSDGALNLIITAVPPTQFRGDEPVVLAVKILGTKSAKIVNGGEIVMPYGEYVGIHMCTQKCMEFYN